MTTSGVQAPQPNVGTSRWRRVMIRDVGLLLGFKAIALALLWFLFFSDSHRPRVDAAAAGRVLGVVVSGRPNDKASVPEASR